jgi:hypothetical protein
MKPGDKVRFLRSSGEGYIKKVNDNNTADIEIEDGFIIPVLRSELVVVASEENKVFSKPDPIRPAPTKVYHKPEHYTKGIYLCLSPFNDDTYNLELINLSENTLLYSVAEYENDISKSLSHGQVPCEQAHKIGQRKLSELKNWSPLLFQVIIVNQEPSLLIPPLLRKISFNPASFFKNKKTHPLSGKEAYIFELKSSGQELAQPSLTASDLFQSKEEELRVIEKPSEILDLHINKLMENHEKCSPEEIVKIQLEAFEKNLELAIATNLKEITYIHGTGNGTLRNHIHKLLGSNPNVEYFKDALKEKFGYGATFVRIK